MRKRPDLAQSSDIAFLLILFFLILATLGQAKALTLDLPEQETTTLFINTELHSIILHHDGRITSDATDLSHSGLIKLLSQRPHLLLSIEEETPWQEVVTILSLIEQYPPESLQMEMVR